MSKSASNIVDRALTLIDEVVTTFSTAATTETSIRNQALEILPELCRDLIKELPWDLKRHLATTATLIEDPLADGEDQSGYTKYKVAYIAPEDFWELVSIRLTTWYKPVTEYIYINGPGYSKQNNPFTRAGEHNPVVALSQESTGSGVRIECFSANINAEKTLSNFQYVSFDNIPDDEDGGVRWADELFDTVTKALATQLNIIKGRIDEATVKGQEISNTIGQHE